MLWFGGDQSTGDANTYGEGMLFYWLRCLPEIAVAVADHGYFRRFPSALTQANSGRLAPVDQNRIALLPPCNFSQRIVNSTVRVQSENLGAVKIGLSLMLNPFRLVFESSVYQAR